MFHLIDEFEKKIALFTGAPYVITTDCCTHAIELCLIYKNINRCSFTAFTYVSIIQTMIKLKIKYSLLDEVWQGEYNFKHTNIWDSALCLQPNMYKKGQLQCLSFGYGKPLDIGRGGAILLDNKRDYIILKNMRYDGRDLSITPWNEQKIFFPGYHYKLNPEECAKGIIELENYISKKNFTIKTKKYPDCRNLKFVYDLYR